VPSGRRSGTRATASLRAQVRLAQGRDLHEELLAVEGRGDAERGVEVLVGEGEEHLAVDRVRLERLGVLGQLDADQPRPHIRRLPLGRRSAAAECLGSPARSQTMFQKAALTEIPNSR